ncbi:restriction endonuclease subunit S [Vibrio parahaemolyticus]|uniref:restriction endonuclease subunit S n=1 Tax=Vibrio parahaemolyticus TaxID=670 RepID=UPI0007A06444|nr:restriction endonuclease subunit S [Vibrio parahaemolyticus]EGQ7972517.1 restriction endonuclease subunit S [Vibrio parahaemolyticus]EGQ8192783.1 restriction endonuclease subunit S [Vibrio parahaemolyticus]EGR3298521.1 restriction endonuclease [Vibrio parahaemolyticus]ELA9292064.1 restriction endonuclease subunit S [Vibrio parahaemolyticus]ELJ8764542.1 restriction endonuclease subunit S [Vibrio parahaemolyticus]
MAVDQSPMNKLITEHIDIWTSAVKTKSTSGRGSSKKLELYGVKKLRELILELAVRGKLVPQDSNDEPASVLLERIEQEKAQLVKEKKIKKPKSLAPIEQDDISYRLPNGWAAARLGNICNKLTDGSHNPAKDAGLGYPMYSSQNVQFRKIDFSNPSRYVDEQDYQKEHARTQVQPGDILLTIVGTLGRAAVVPEDAPDFVLQRSVAVIESALNSDFLTYFFAAPICIKYFEEHGKGTAQKGIYLGKLSLMPVFVPPLEEQHRIVAKVDELMALCDQLEQQTESSIEAHQVLVTTLLDTLTNSADANELMQNWARISEHFDTLFTTEESIDQLKQTILQLAVMGKLVPQDPSDEPATELLKRIAEEKAQLVKEKKIKKQKALPPIAEDEKPFELPSGWEWCRFGSLFKSFSNGLYKPAKFYTDAGVISLRMYNIQDGKIDFEGAKRVEVEPNELEQFLLEKGDLLINRVNSKELVGKTAIIPQLDEPLVYESMNMRAKPFTNYLSAEYLNLFMMTALAQQSISSFAKEAIGQASINQGQVSSMAIPLPTFNEQKRIVLKINELLVICEELKARLKESQNTQLLLTDAIVEQAV